MTTTGRPMGGRVFTGGALYHLLQNRHYIGEICHRDVTYPGLHAPIVEAKLFEAVQRKIAKNRVRRREQPIRADKALLMGRIFDEQGRSFTPTVAVNRHGNAYGYYVRSDLQTGGKETDPRAGPVRLPAKPLEAAVRALLQRLSGQEGAPWGQLAPILRRLEARPEEARLTLDAEALFQGDHPTLAFEDLLGRLADSERAVMLNEGEPAVIVAIPGRLQFWGGRTWRKGPRPGGAFDAGLAKALTQAHRVLAQASCAPDVSDADLAEAQAPQNAYARARCEIAFLAPDLQAAILAGRQPRGLTLARLHAGELPLAWADQRTRFGSD